jgi:hypothetical protein
MMIAKRYEVLGKIGAGASGLVLLVWCKIDLKLFACKLVEDEMEELFVNEKLFLQKL